MLQATLLNRLMSGTVALTFLSISEEITVGNTFYIYGVIGTLPPRPTLLKTEALLKTRGRHASVCGCAVAAVMSPVGNFHVLQGVFLWEVGTARPATGFRQDNCF